MRVGFVGLGNQGTPIAERIATSGTVETVVWARRDEALTPFRGGNATIAGSLAELGAGLDLLVTCLFDAEGTREVLFGPAGAAHTMPRGATIMCHSTVSPGEITGLAAQAAELGLVLLDAPVTGGAPKAAAGELVVMVGGDETAYRAALPVLETYSDLVIHLGPVGAGQQAKLLNNTLLAAHIAIADDLFTVASRLGLDAAGLGRVLSRGSGRSYGIDVYLGFGSLEPMTATPLLPALAKDVALLDGVLDGWDDGRTLLTPARQLIADLEEAARTTA
jgi:3-hydroxyisobutyrate dehydrogenase-like beta-hydroxyacid dehydrogenase